MWPPSWSAWSLRSSLMFVPSWEQWVIKGFAKIAVPLYDLTSGENKDKKAEPVTLTPEALEAFQTLKDKCMQAPVLAFSDFKKPFILETDALGKGLGMVLLQKLDDGWYLPITFAS